MTDDPHDEHPGLRWKGSGQPVTLDRLVGIDHSDVATPDDDPRVDRPGWMRATWPSLCRACGTSINDREMQALHDVPGFGRSWAHGGCAEPEREVG